MQWFCSNWIKIMECPKIESLTDFTEVCGEWIFKFIYLYQIPIQLTVASRANNFGSLLFFEWTRIRQLFISWRNCWWRCTFMWSCFFKELFFWIHFAEVNIFVTLYYPRKCVIFGFYIVFVKMCFYIIHNIQSCELPRLMRYTKKLS